MKKYFCLLLFSSTLALSGYSQVTNTVFRPKGKVSDDIENANNETDPRFNAVVVNAANMANTKTKGNSNNKNLSQVEQGIAIVEDIVDRLISRDYSFSLLSGHKYMVNSCLGLKVSAGNFDLRFANPEIGITGGKFIVKLKVEKIKFSAFKVRSRPRAPDFSDPDPCHFSGKFEIGGEATNVSVRVTMDLVAIGSSTVAGYCALAFGEPVEIKWTIGGFNLRPMPNTIDHLGKEMVEDALNNGMTDLVYNRLMAAAGAVLPEYFETCESAEEFIKNAGSNANPSTEEPGNDKWTSKPFTGLAEGMGRLNLEFPDGIDWRVDIYNAANKFITNRSSALKHPSHPLAAGTYNIKLNTVPVQGVIIKPGKETRIRYGVLDIKFPGSWELRTENDKFLTSGNKPKKLALPVGRYILKEAKNPRTVTVTELPEESMDEQPEEVKEDEKQEEKWTMKNTGAGGLMGKLDLNYPKSEWDMAIFNESTGEYVQTISGSNNLADLELGPGKYKLVLNNVPVEGVPVESGSITALKVGALDVKANSAWTLWDSEGKNHFKTENGAVMKIFPVGKYVIKMGGASVNVEVKEGEVVQL